MAARMAHLTPEQLDTIADQCRGSIAEIATGLNRCFETDVALTVGESSAWSAVEEVEWLSGPGLSFTLMTGKSGFLVLVPATFPLPEWYAAPDDAESARLETLRTELSQSVIPDEFRGGETACLPTEDLKTAVILSDPTEFATCIEFSSEESGENARFLLVGPVEHPPLDHEEPVAVEPAPAETVLEGSATEEQLQDATTSSESTASQFPEDDWQMEAVVDRSRRLMQLEVPVTVRLAEKKIELGQLLKLYPGSLITFPKSCDDLLDMYVNNQLFARGEAVKIGEKFGLKVNEIGAEVVRESGVFTI